MTIRIGLTGPIGCGKSTIAGWLAAQPGVVAVDADALAAVVLAPGTPETAAVYARFGDDLRDEAGVLDRAALGRIVFADAAALRDLEAIVHPAVRTRLLAWLATAEADGARAVLIEAIKLIEGGLAEMCDEVWLVTCDPDDQRARLAGRGADAADIDARIRAQGPIRERLAHVASRTLDSSGAPSRVRSLAEASLVEALQRRP